MKLYNSLDVCVTFHYDTTSRCNIDGEWPALILNFADCPRFNLRPLFFAYEDRENISELIFETYSRLAAATSIALKQDIDANSLWGKTNNLMTDSVTKNLQIGELVAEKLQSLHVPYHLLCKAHVVEKFDATNLEVLASVEKCLKLRERMESINYALKPFFRGKSAIVVAGIYVVLKLVSHDKSGNTVSLADEFDRLIEQEGLVKHMSMYKEQRFTKLGYCAASILQALPQLLTLPSKTCVTNLLIESCRLYLHCKLFITELRLLAYFTKHVTLPYLNCVDKMNQKDLTIFPQLYKDMLANNHNCLKDFHVDYRHVTVPDLTSETERADEADDVKSCRGIRVTVWQRIRFR